MAKTIIVDIDGTIADLTHRLKYIELHPQGPDGDLRKDWDGFYDAAKDDEPIEEMVELVRDLVSIGYNLIFVTGRSERIRVLTEQWLKKHIMWDPEGVPFRYPIFMRKEGDRRPDHVIKKEIYNTYIKDKFDIKFVLEDRGRVVEMWRYLGIRCLQVASGAF